MSTHCSSIQDEGSGIGFERWWGAFTTHFDSRRFPKTAVLTALKLIIMLASPEGRLIHAVEFLFPSLEVLI